MTDLGLEKINWRAVLAGAMIKSFVVALFMSAGIAFILSMAASRNSGWQGGMMTGFIMAILLVGGSTFPNYAFENKSVRNFLIHMGNTAIAMMLVGALMGYW